jgi:hypothetical protein
MFTYLRAVVYLKKIYSELKRSNDLSEARLRLEFPAWRKSDGEINKTPKLMHIDNPSIEDWNKHYDQLHPKVEEEE